MRSHYILPILLCVSLSSIGQDQNSPLPINSSSFGIEFQAYLAGIMPGIVFEKKFSQRHGWHARIGANLADRHDWGKHDDETGSGYGATLGYRYYFETFNQNFSVGPRIDFWQMKIDWVGSNLITITNTMTGTSDISIFQPTLELAWWLPFKKGAYEIGVSITNGFEINVKTEGEDVGEGLISLIGITARKSLN